MLKIEDSDVAILHECKEYLDEFFKYREIITQKNNFFKDYKLRIYSVYDHNKLILKKQPKTGCNDYILITGDIHRYNVETVGYGLLTETFGLDYFFITKGYVITNLKKRNFKMECFVCQCCDIDFYNDNKTCDEHILNEEKSSIV